jgi:hypothetical protein
MTARRQGPRLPPQGALTRARDRPHDAGVKQVTIRIELRISEQMNEYLATEAYARKLSFEGLLVSWIEERMNAQREQTRRRVPG